MRATTATLTVPGDSPLVCELLNCDNTRVHVTVQTENLRATTYRVDTFDYEYRDGGWAGTAHLQAVRKRRS